jgi:hypothetical protein
MTSGLEHADCPGESGPSVVDEDASLATFSSNDEGHVSDIIAQAHSNCPAKKISFSAHRIAMYVLLIHVEIREHYSPAVRRN